MTSDPLSPRVVVVGGGVSGLSAAEALARAGDVRVLLLEGSPRLGGIVQTERTDGFVLERGPDVAVAAKPALRRLAERLGIADRLHGTSIRGAYVLQRGALRRIPPGLSGLVPTRLDAHETAALLSPNGFARATEETSIPPSGAADESVASFMVRRFGREMYEQLNEPMLTGIYAGDGARLSMEATFPQLRAMEREHGSLLRAFAARAASAPPAEASPFLSFPTGMHELVEALERALLASGRVEIRRETPVRSVHEAPDGGARVVLASGETIDADAVIVATPAPVAARLLAGADAALATELGAIEHGSTAMVTIAVRTADVPRALDATGYVVPRVDGRAVLACTWASSKLPGRAPEGMALFRLFIGGAQHPELVTRDDAELIALARAELREVMGITAEPVLVRVGRWIGAMPQYVLGHPARVGRIEALAAPHAWLALAGNALRGVGVPDCIASGEAAAERTLASLRGSVISRR